MNRDLRRARLLPVLGLLALTACGTTYDWRELHAGERRLDDIWNAIHYVAETAGYRPGYGTDRGLNVYTSRWRERTQALGRAGRHRLKVEVVEEHRDRKGWLIRYCVERQRVDDLGLAWNPTEDDWSDAGQDAAREEVFGARLSRLLAPVQEYPAEAPGS